ncbi:MAG: nucleotide sugar dehydrogenase, partial [Bacteroidetes bacterium]|nr:nucleotide sugar dehydrogenase [Bacteroidota bacterium]
MKSLLDKIKNKSAVVGVIGLGYIGLPLSLEFASKGFNVIGFDVDEIKIPLLNSGKSYIKHISDDRIKLARNQPNGKSADSRKFEATSDFSRLSSCDAIIICVPTPLNEHREPEMKYIVETAKTIQKYLMKGQLIILESTTYPGTTEEILLPMFEASTGSASEKFIVGEDFFLAFSPEREDPNNANYTTATIPKVVGGVTENCLEAAQALYDQVIVKTVPVSSTRVAEATKLLENIYRSVNIALVNELKTVFHKMDIDIWEVIEAAKTKPFGFKAFYPGPGLGGHCIPIDPFYLTWKAREFDINTRFIELAGEINTNQPYYVVQRAMEALNEQSKALKGSKVLILGASYKKNIDDMRESPSLKLIEILKDKGAKVDYNDPFVPKLLPTRKYK